MTGPATQGGHYPYADRRDAGRVLARHLEPVLAERRDVVVLGLPRGGIPVAFEVAQWLGVPLDVLLVRKVGAPGREELAMGAVASGGVMVRNEDVIRALGARASPQVVERLAEVQRRELARREAAYRGDRPGLEVAGRTVVLVDDGLATGASMRAALQAVRRLEPARVIVAVPTGEVSTCHELERLADEVLCAAMPSPFFAVGQSYLDFAQTSDRDVRRLLRAAWTHGGPGDSRDAPRC